MYCVGWAPDNTLELERSSLLVVSAGAILSIIGVIGVIKSRKKIQPNTELEPI
jgi:hypothetical protein